MLHFRRFLLTLTFFSILMTSAYSQEDVLRPKGKIGTETESYNGGFFDFSRYTIGVDLGMNMNFFNQKMDWFYDHGTVYDDLTSASGLSPHFDVFYDHWISDNAGLIIKLGYDSKFVSKSTSGDDIDNVPFFELSHPVDLQVDILANYVTLTPAFRYNVNDNLVLTAGLALHFLAGEVETTWAPEVKDGTELGNFLNWQLLAIISGNYDGLNYTKATFTAKTGINDNPELAEKIRTGIELGVGYKVQLSKDIWLVPQAKFQYMFTPITTDTFLASGDGTNYYVILETSKRNLYSLQLSLGLWFDFISFGGAR